MPHDPGPNRKHPAPSHPAGFPALDDAPVHLAPAVDVRPKARRSQIPPPPTPSSEPTSQPNQPVSEPRRGEVAFGLAVPAEERRGASEPPPPEHEVVPDSIAPATVDWDRVTNQRLEALKVPIPLPTRTTHDPDPAQEAEERDAILRDLRSIGPLEEGPDRGVERSVGLRATLARARALRFRLCLIDAWSSVEMWSEPFGDMRALQLDLAIDAMLLVALADGAPCREGGREDPARLLPVVPIMVETLRGIRSDLPRTALRERGSAAIARLTIVGWRPALEQLARTALASPPETRQLALELAARVALVPRIDEHRLGALQDLEKALGLPPGHVAAAIEAARRRVARARSSG